MHIGLLYYSDTLLQNHQLQKLNGRGMANAGFLKALLKYKASHQISIIVSANWEREMLEQEFDEIKSSQTPLITLLELKNYLKKNPLDVLHYPSPDLYRAFEIKKLNPKPLAVTGLTHSLGNAPFLEWLTLTLLAKPSSSDALICTSKAAVEVLSKMQKRVHRQHQLNAIQTPCIPLGIETSSFKAADLKQSNKVIYLYLGRISQASKCDLKPLLLTYYQAFRLSPTTLQNTQLILAGACDENGYLEELQHLITFLQLQNFVSFETNPDENKKRALLEQAHVFVAPNDNPQETFGISIIEAMASGLALIAADWNGYKNLIQEGEQGFLIPTLIPNDLEFMSDTAALQVDTLNHLHFSQATAMNLEVYSQRIIQLAENSDLRHKMSSKALETSKRYDWRVVIAEYFQLWEDLCKNAKNLSLNDSQHTGSATLNYHEVFSHYASQTLDPQQKFSLSHLGQQLFKGDNNLLLNNPLLLDDLLEVNSVIKVLQHAEKSVCLNEIVDIPQATFILMWLYKQGLLKENEASFEKNVGYLNS